MELVVNEWLPEYLRPTETIERKKLAVTFLTAFMFKGDVMVVRKPSEFLNKIYRYAHEFSDDTRNYKHLFKTIHLDSERTRFIEDASITKLPREVEEKLIAPYNSDKYLFEAALCSSDRI